MKLFGREIIIRKLALNKAIDQKANTPSIQANRLSIISSANGITNSLQNTSGLIDAFEQTPEVYSVVSYMANALSKVKIDVHSGTFDNLGKKYQRHDLLNLLKEPNYYQSYSEFIRQAFAYWFVDGNIYINGLAPVGMKPEALYLLPNQHTSILLKSSGEKDFRAFKNESTIDKYIVETQKFKLRIDYKNVMHKRNTGLKFDQQKYLFGLSPLLSQKYPINSLLQNYEAQCAIIANRGAMGILSPDAPEFPISSTDKDDLNKQYIDTYGLSENQYKVIISSFPIKYTRVGMDIGELQLNETNKANYRAVCRALAFPSVILNDNEGAKFDNMKSALNQLWSDNLVPLFDDFCNDLTVFLNQWWPDIVLMPNYSGIEAIQKDKKGLCETLNYQFDRGIITPDEYRKELGLPEINTPEMQQRYLSGNYKPISQAQQSPDNAL